MYIVLLNQSKSYYHKRIIGYVWEEHYFLTSDEIQEGRELTKWPQRMTLAPFTYLSKLLF